MLLNRLQLWRVVPIDCGMLKQLFGGAYGKAPPNPKAPPQANQGKLYPFGDFMGSCKATFEDESAKINLNRFANYQDAKVLRQQLWNLFSPKKYDPMFERRRANDQYVTRKDQIAAFEDWVDSNKHVTGEVGTSEDSKYRYSDRGYITKNSYFDSLEEIRMVYGVDDLFFQHFAKLFTVYGPTLRININEAEPAILSALVMTYAKLKPQEKTIFFRPEYQQFLQAMVAYRSYLGFNSRDEFVRWVKNPVLLDPRMYPGAATGGQTIMRDTLPKFVLDVRRMGSIILTEADTFRITSVGHVGNVSRRITSVIHVQPRGKRTVYYWRLH